MLTAINSDNQEVLLPCSIVLGDRYDTYVANSIVLDLVNVFCAVYIADICTRRAAKRRKICVSAPVSIENLQIWNSCSGLIIKLLKFVTEGDNDEWGIDFSPIQYQLPHKQLILEGLDTRVFDNVSLLSGGLDSFCGIYDNQINGKTALYCGYKTNVIDASYISKVYSFAKEVKTDSELCLFEKVNANKITPTQRTRSLLFFSLACFCAVWKNLSVINVHENGIMTLNPSFESRGTTKTTHPKTVYLYQELLRHLGLNINIENPFLFFTKGEMVMNLPQHFREQIENTRSCSRSLQDIRYRRKGISSCGTCVPCLLRKISLAAYDMEEYDHDYFVPYDGDFNDNEYNSAFSYYERFSRAIDNETILANLEIRKSFYLEDDYLEKTNSLLVRFNRELKTFFDKYGR